MARARIAAAAALVLFAATTTAARASAGVPHHRAGTSTQSAAVAAHHPDFNHDGYADLVVSAQGDSVAGATDSGGVWVLYGGAHGANTSNRHKYFTEASIGRGASSGIDDGFGFSWTTGDFNGDGYDDLAIGAVGKTINGQSHAGAVVVLYGSASGLVTSNAQFFSEATSGMPSTPATDDYFGTSVAAGDFNHDGRADLAIGAFGRSVGGAGHVGAVYELFGTSHGLSHTSPLLPKEFDETTPGLHGGAKAFDSFGDALVAADFDGDHYADLAVSVYGKTISGNRYAGAVDVLRGSPSGLTGTGAQTWTEDTSGVPDSAEVEDQFGATLGALDINGDGRSELVIGAPSESQGSTESVGAATVLYGSAHGLTADGALFYLLSNTTVGQTPAAHDYFGSSFTSFDFDGDGRPDLAIGVEERDVGGAASAGEVVVLHNVGGRLSRSGGFTLDRNTPGMIGPAGANQDFGALVRGGDWSGNGTDDLAVGLPDLVVSGHSAAGGMQVFYSAGSKLATNDQLFTANSLGGTPYTEATLGGYDY
ncbi:MAG TPA: hypothetical protein VGI86_22280 [Acidimicrobiia bacterium]